MAASSSCRVGLSCMGEDKDEALQWTVHQPRTPPFLAEAGRTPTTTKKTDQKQTAVSLPCIFLFEEVQVPCTVSHSLANCLYLLARG